MSFQSAWIERPVAPATGSRDPWAARPRYGVTDFITLLWRERWLMIGVFLVLFGLGAAGAFLMKTTYPAHASILVRLGQEYVYEPSVGDAARGAIPNTDQLIQTETEIMGSSQLREQVIRELGMNRVAPDFAKPYAAATGEAKRAVMAKAVAAMGQNLKIVTAPDTTIVRLDYIDTDPVRATLVLNRLIDDYLIYRRGILMDSSAPVVAEQRRHFEAQLADTDAEYQSLMAENGVTDFDSEKTSLNTLQSSLTDEDYRVRARLEEISGRLGEVSRQEGATPAEISLYHDTDVAAPQKLNQLQIDLQDLLARYRPDSQPVRDKQAQITQMQALIASGRSQAEGVRRVGVNPVFQTVQTERNQLSAEAASLKQREAALTAQIAQAGARRRTLNEIEPRIDALERDRELLQANIKSLVQKEQQIQAVQAISARSNDNIRVVERPAIPTKGKSLKKPLFILAFLFAGFTALCAGLLRIFLRRGFATPASAAKTLDLPVLATAGFKRA